MIDFEDLDYLILNPCMGIANVYYDSIIRDAGISTFSISDEFELDHEEIRYYFIINVIKFLLIKAAVTHAIKLKIEKNDKEACKKIIGEIIKNIEKKLFEDFFYLLKTEIIVENRKKEIEKSELKRCPFCFKNVSLQSFLENKSELYYICCANVNCPVLVKTHPVEIKEKAIEAWNERAEHAG